MKKKNIILGTIAIISLIMFFYVFSRISLGTIREFDEFIYGLFTRNDTLTIVMKLFTCFAEPVTVIILTILLFIAMKDKKEAFMIPCSVGAVSLINLIVKSIVKRSRPYGIALIKIGGYSFPSGHSSAALAFYGILIYLIYKKWKNGRLKTLAIIGLLLVIGLVGISRIYLGVHYASDVVGGFMYSLAYLIVFIIFYNHYILKSD